MNLSSQNDWPDWVEGHGTLAYSRKPFYAGIVLLLVTWTSVLLPGFMFPGENNLFHIPVVLNYAGSAEGPHDAFTKSLGAFVSALWLILNPISNEENVFWVFFGCHFLGRLLFIGGIYAIFRHFGARGIISMAAAGATSVAPFFKGATTVGHSEMLTNYLSQTSFAIALLPLTWLLLLRRSWLWGAAALGGIFNINAFVAAWSLLAFVALFVVQNGISLVSLRKVLAPAAVFSLCAAPTLFWILSTLGPPQDEIDFRAFLLYRVAYHTFVHVQLDSLALYSAYLFSVAPVAWIAARAENEAHRPLLILSAAYLFVFLLAIPLPYLTGSRLMLNLYPLRMSSALNIALSTLLMSWAASRLSSVPDDKLPVAIAIAALSGNIMAVPIMTLLWSNREGRGTMVIASALATFVVIVILLIVGLPPSVGEDFAPLVLLFAGGAILFLGADTLEAPFRLGAILAVAASYIWVFLFQSSTLGMASAAALGIFAVLVAVLASLPGRQLLFSRVDGTAMLAAILALGVALGGYAVWRGSIMRPDADPGPALAAQRWFRQTTKPDTSFLPIDVKSFGLFSRRPAWVDFQSGAAAMWQPGYYHEWRRRWDQVRACHDSACYAGVARDNGVEWLVARTGQMIDLENAGLVKAFGNRDIEIFYVAAKPDLRAN